MDREQEEKACARKIRHRTEAEALKLEESSKYLLRAYRCSVCFGWHMTSMATARNFTVVRCYAK